MDFNGVYNKDRDEISIRLTCYGFEIFVNGDWFCYEAFTESENPANEVKLDT